MTKNVLHENFSVIPLSKVTHNTGLGQVTRWRVRYRPRGRASFRQPEAISLAHNATPATNARSSRAWMAAHPAPFGPARSVFMVQCPAALAGTPGQHR